MSIFKIGGSVLFEHHKVVAQGLATWSGKLLVIIGYGLCLRLLSRMHGLPERQLQNMAGSWVWLTDDVNAAAAYFAASFELSHLPFSPIPNAAIKAPRCSDNSRPSLDG